MWTSLDLPRRGIKPFASESIGNPIGSDPGVDLVAMPCIVMKCSEHLLEAQMRQVQWNLLGGHTQIPKLRNRSNWRGSAGHDRLTMP